MAAKTPDEVTGLVLWFDADQITGFSDGDFLTQWNDESGNTDHAVQATEVKQPTYETGEVNGKPIVRFDGTDWLLTPELGNYTQPNTLIVVAKDTGGISASAYVTDGHIGGGRHMFGFRNAESPRTVYTYGGTAYETTSVGAQNAYHIWVAVFDGASAFTREDGVLLSGSGDTGTNALQRFIIGMTKDETLGFFGDVAEIILYTTLVSTADIESLEEGLADKYDIDAGYGGDVEVTPTVAQLEITGYDPVVSAQSLNVWDIGAYIFPGTIVTVLPTIAEIDITGYNPVVGATGAGVEVEATLGKMEITGLNPVVSSSRLGARGGRIWDRWNNRAIRKIG